MATKFLKLQDRPQINTDGWSLVPPEAFARGLARLEEIKRRTGRLTRQDFRKVMRDLNASKVLPQEVHL